MASKWTDIVRCNVTIMGKVYGKNKEVISDYFRFAAGYAVEVERAQVIGEQENSWDNCSTIPESSGSPISRPRFVADATTCLGRQGTAKSAKAARPGNGDAKGWPGCRDLRNILKKSARMRTDG